MQYFSQKRSNESSESSSSSSLESRMGPSNHDEHDVDVSLAKIVDDALLGGIVSVGVSGWPEPDDDQPPPFRPEPDSDRWPGLLCASDCEPLPSWPVLASFFKRFSFARRFWNQTFLLHIQRSKKNGPVSLCVHRWNNNAHCALKRSSKPSTCVAPLPIERLPPSKLTHTTTYTCILQ